MEIQHVTHPHPLVFNGSDEKAYCSGCDEEVSGPVYSCVEGCRFHLDKKCAEAPSQIDHPFHRNHSLQIGARNQNFCDFCRKSCKIAYHCSCDLDLHIKCAFFLCEIVEKGTGELQHIVHKRRLSSIEYPSKEELKKAKCLACRKLLFNSIDFALDCGFPLHRECVELPLEINQLCHLQHSLFLQFNIDRLSCTICQEIQKKGFVYSCSTCKVALHSECVSTSPIVEDSCHKHSFINCSRRFSFTCDACGTSKNRVSYICSTCSLTVHKNCISLPCIIKSIWHRHPIFLKYFLLENECGILECVVCHEEVNKEYGSYCCSECKFVVHVNCAIEDPRFYDHIESKEDYEKLVENQRVVYPSFLVIKEIQLGEYVTNKEINHFSHEHNLVLYDEVEDKKCCDCCSLFIETCFYHCSECDFCLHKSCAELPRQNQFWLQIGGTFNLIPNVIFFCVSCEFLHSGFMYQLPEKDELFICIKCFEFSLTWTSQGHKEHPLLFYRKYDGQCNACGNYINEDSAYRCKGCNFNVHMPCTLLPLKAKHKCDKHLLTLIYNENNDYAEYHYCDICEEKRNPDIWFYHCASCDTSAHPKCVLRDYPFIKLGRRFFKEKIHPHSLIFVQKVYLYPECSKCGEPCLDLALECAKTGCNFIIHIRCSSLLKDKSACPIPLEG